MAIKRLTQGTILDVQASGDYINMRNGTKIKMLTGSQIVPNSGTQASAVTPVTLSGTYGNDTLASQTAINAIITAIKNVGITA